MKQKLLCDGSVTLEECSEVIKNMKLNKNPGLDGLTVEFYKMFQEMLKYVLVKVYDKGHEDNL